MSKLVSQVIGKLISLQKFVLPTYPDKAILFFGKCLCYRYYLFIILCAYIHIIKRGSLIVLIVIRCFFYPPNALNKPLFQCQAKPLSCCIRSEQHSILSHDKKVEPDEASSFVTLMHERMYTKRFLWFFLLIVLCCIHFFIFMACLLLYPCNHSVLFFCMSWWFCEMRAWLCMVQHTYTLLGLHAIHMLPINKMSTIATCCSERKKPCTHKKKYFFTDIVFNVLSSF